jgi:hypothetical protein
MRETGPYPDELIKKWTKGEAQPIVNSSYPRSALSLHFAM